MRLYIVKLWIVVAVLTYISTEFFSVFDSLTPFWIRLFWGSVLGIYFYRWFISTPKYLSFFSSISANKAIFYQLPRTYRVLVITSLITVLMPLLFLALYSVPNNVDSINYHLTRVVCWLQNHNVKHYPTFHVQQLYHNVMSEYILLHVLALSGHDFFLHLVQFSAMVGSILGVGLIAQLMGLSYNGQLIISILQLSLPIGVLEATTTQNDYVATFFFIGFVYFGLRFRKTIVWQDALWMSVCLALGGFTKYPVFFYSLPYCLWIGFEVFRQKGVKIAFGLFSLSFLVLTIVFLPFFWRNYQLFNNILGPSYGHPLFVENIAAEKYHLLYTVSNVVKNMGLHLGLPNVNWNFQIDKIVFFIHELLRMDVNNPLVSLDTYRTQFVIQEDMSGNFLMFLFLIGTCFWILFQKDAIAFKGILLCALAGFLVFCTATKFQLWSSRTHLPLFAQGTILVGFLLSKCTNRWRIAIAYLFVLAALPYVFDNFNKPLIPLRYASKYILGYIPQYLCLPSEANIALYRKSFDNSYNFEEGSPCFPLKNTPSYTEKQEMITKLSNLGYYKRESEHIFKHPREAYFFINDASFLSTYSDFKSLTKLIPQSTQTVGLMFNHQLGFYHYWHLLKKYLSPNVQMKYVLFHKEYLVLPNANRIFAYEYLLCDNQKLIDKYISKKDIRAVYRTQSLLLVQLKKPSLTYYFITQ